VEEYLDTPLKRYSSGMQLRLAFAVAAHLEPELMLVDEILAVGDVEFQRRCVQRMSRLSHEGRTVVFVSHDLGSITRLCSRAIWVDHGRIVADGAPADVVADYYASLMGGGGEARFDLRDAVGVTHIGLVDDDGAPIARPVRGEPFTIQARVVAATDVPHLDIAMHVVSENGTLVFSETWSDQPDLPQLITGPGEYHVRLRIPPLLRAGDYVLGLWLGSRSSNYFDDDGALGFSVVPQPGDRQEVLARKRAVQPAVGWSSVREGDLAPVRAMTEVP
jgi:ABC-2 type transport system ATP-binding protein/lipopolysaccharide transport system ATP-binding protein